MNEFKENHSNEIPKTQDFSQPLEYKNFSLDDLIREVNTLCAETTDFIERLTTDITESINFREYGLQECSDAAKSIFTLEVLSEWSGMNYEQRQQIVQEYSKIIGEGLDIDFKGVIFEPLVEQMGALGYNSGDGYIHLDYSYITDPSQIIGLIDTVAHEARHQFQSEAIHNPEKIGLDKETIKEWATGFENYTTQYATAYDPWGYFYNPVEIDARYFGESMVRELTKDLINQA